MDSGEDNHRPRWCQQIRSESNGSWASKQPLAPSEPGGKTMMSSDNDFSFKAKLYVPDALKWTSVVAMRLQPIHSVGILSSCY